MMTSPAHSSTNQAAAALKERNRGTTGDWLFTGYDDKFDSPRPKARTTSDEARSNATRDQGSMSGVMNMGDKEREWSPKHQAGPRKTGPAKQRVVSDEARKNMAANTGNGCREVFATKTDNGHVEPDLPCKTRIRPEARANAAKNAGSLGQTADETDSGAMQSPRGTKGSEAAMWKDRNQGSLSFSAPDAAFNPPKPRVKTEGAAHAQRSHGTGIMACMHHADTD